MGGRGWLRRQVHGAMWKAEAKSALRQHEAEGACACGGGKGRGQVPWSSPPHLPLATGPPDPAGAVHLAVGRRLGPLDRAAWWPVVGWREPRVVLRGHGGYVVAIIATCALVGGVMRMGARGAPTRRAVQADLVRWVAVDRRRGQARRSSRAYHNSLALIITRPVAPAQHSITDCAARSKARVAPHAAPAQPALRTAPPLRHKRAHPACTHVPNVS